MIRPVGERARVPRSSSEWWTDSRASFLDISWTALASDMYWENCEPFSISVSLPATR